MSEILVVFEKEWISEVRSKHGLFTSSLFGLLAVVAISIASYGKIPSPTLAAGMMNVCLLFSSIMIVPIIFLIEQDQQTFQLLQMLSRPTIIFFGKVIYSIVMTLISVLLLSFLFSILTQMTVPHFGLFLMTLLAESIILSVAISLCSALSFQASNRLGLTSVLALALLLPQVFLCVSALRVALGEGSLESGIQSLIGLFGFTLALFGLSPLWIEALWKAE